MLLLFALLLIVFLLVFFLIKAMKRYSTAVVSNTIIKEEENANSNLISYDVFISKKTEDSSMAKDVCLFLEQNGISCFISERDLPSKGNTNYYQIIDDALEHSTNLVVVCSQASYLKSKWVQHEWQAFSNELLSSNRAGNIITIRGDRVERKDIPFTLRNLELLDWHNYRHYLLSYIIRSHDTYKEPCELTQVKTGGKNTWLNSNYDFCLCYSKCDLSDITEICGLLRKAGLKCWSVDEAIKEVGRSTQVWIGEGIKQSKYFLFFHSEHTNKSHFPIAELKYALDFGAKVIPIKLDKSAYSPELKMMLIGLKTIELANVGNLEELVSKIIRITVDNCD